MGRCPTTGNRTQPKDPVARAPVSKASGQCAGSTDAFTSAPLIVSMSNGSMPPALWKVFRTLYHTLFRCTQNARRYWAEIEGSTGILLSATPKFLSLVAHLGDGFGQIQSQDDTV